MTTKITPKANRFKKLLLTRPDLTPVECVKKVFNVSNDFSARSMACEYMKRVGVTIADLLERQGLDDQHDADFLAKKISAKKKIIVDGEEYGQEDDNPTQLKAFELSQKLKGRLLPPNYNNTINNTQINISYGYRRERQADASSNADNIAVRD